VFQHLSGFQFLGQRQVNDLWEAWRSDVGLDAKSRPKEGSTNLVLPSGNLT